MGWTKEQTVRRIVDVGLIPIVRTSSAELALRAAEAMIEGGIGIAEITMTVPNALKVLEQLAARFGGQVLFGAGTVLDRKSCEAAIEAGAEFIVSPSFEPPVVEQAGSRAKAVIPGALTPTEILAAWRAGADLVKVFPCGPVGGPRYIRALKGPFPDLPLVPTGGVNLETTPLFIEAGAAAVAVGGELVNARALESGNESEIAATARKYVEAIRAARTKAAK